MKFAYVGAAVALIVGTAASSAVIARLCYSGTAASVEYGAENEYRMWFVPGDTVGEPITSRVIERHSYLADGEQIRLTVAMAGEGFESNTGYTITPGGRVIEVDGIPVAEVARARVDLLPRFPEAASEVRPGSEWVDTVSSASQQPYGDAYYRVTRHYRVQSLEQGVALLVSRGELALKQGGWQDSTAGAYWWQEVKGPVVDSVWFDIAAGLIRRNVTVMHLVGKGGAAQGSQGVEFPSGLDSRVDRTRK